MEIRRRRWVIRRLLKRLQRIALDARGVWLMKKKQKIDRAIEDLLELSSYVKVTFLLLNIDKCQSLVITIH